MPAESLTSVIPHSVDLMTGLASSFVQMSNCGPRFRANPMPRAMESLAAAPGLAQVRRIADQPIAQFADNEAPVIPVNDHMWVAVNGTVPGTGDPSCWRACKMAAAATTPNENYISDDANPKDWGWTDVSPSVVSAWQDLTTQGVNTSTNDLEWFASIWYTE